jgi:CHAT domain-containing protein/tetratricopeptide (TPR) repeat protein
MLRSHRLKRRDFAVQSLLVLAGALALYAAGALASGPTMAQTQAELEALNRRALELSKAGKYAEAIPLAERFANAVSAKYGPDSSQHGTALNNLAQLLQDTNRLAEAEPLMRRALAIAEKSYGPAHPDVAVRLNNLAQLLRDTNRLAEAEPLMRRALASGEKVHGPEHPTVAIRLNNLAGLLRDTNRMAEAEPLYRRALAIDEKHRGLEHPDVARDLNNLAQLLRATNRIAEAEPLMRRALAIEEKSRGPEHSLVAIRLNNLALLLRATNRLAEAEPLMRRALAIEEKIHGPDHTNVAVSLNNLAQLMQANNRLAEAEPLMRRALAITEKSYGPAHPAVAIRLNNLAGLLRDTNRMVEAELLYRRALTIDEKSNGPAHPTVAVALNNLAILLGATNRPTEAEPMLRRALAIDEKSYGPGHPTVATRLNNLALLRANLEDWADAARLHRRAVPIMTAGGGRIDLVRATLGANSRNLRASARAVFRADAASPHARNEGFALAQWALQTGAADALAQMTARFAKGSGPLAALVRQRQDLLVRRQEEDKRLLAAVGAADAKTGDASRIAVAALDVEIGALDRRLVTEFPDYAALANPGPLGLADTQALLRDNEALVLVLDVPRIGGLAEESLIWVVTKADARWGRSDLGSKALTERVAALRCGLDGAAWDGEGASRCSRLLGHAPAVEGSTGRSLAFNLAEAHALYSDLFGQFEDSIKGKHLLIVSGGPLIALPFQALVTEKPALAIPTDATGYADAAWLAKSHATTVLPSVGSLKALRRFAKASKAARPFIGFGNPLLLGPDGNDRRAWERQSCKGGSSQMQIANRRIRAATSDFFRGSLADVEEVRAQYPLPETADELCAVARSMNAGDEAVHLGEKASETTIKALSARGALANARVVHFATHGLLAGETKSLAASTVEPALLLTPPAQATEENDGLLTASEIAQLKLDADWVVLSACNTAGGDTDKPNAEALSGLARAFFYAGARALLVSHWAVNSEATVKLIVKGFDELKSDPNIGRAEAMRRSALALIASGGSGAHPANWAPFVVVGEGAP